MKGVYLKKGNTKVTVVPYYRVGDLFLTTIATNPSNFLGGTWELFGPGRCLVCVNTSDGDFNTVKKTGGSKTHYHWLPYMDYNMGLAILDTSMLHKRTSGIYPPQDAGNWWFNKSGTTGSASGGAQHGTSDSNSLQPYITCYIWIRTA